jgi:thiosulfate/3-mercaptopyruvate sulfurtransferase
MRAQAARKLFLQGWDVANGKWKDYRLVDVRYKLGDPTYGRQKFLAGHAPGAAFADLDADLAAADHSRGRHPLPRPADFIEWCMRNRVGDPRTAVLCYDDSGGGLAAARLWWMLDSLGVEAYILDGGYQTWQATEQHEEAGEPQQVKPLPDWPHGTTFARALVREEIPINALLVDARPAARFDSTVRPFPPDPCPGHVPFAVNHPWTSNLRPSSTSLLDADELRTNMLRSLGGAAVSEAVFMCGSSVTACHNIAVARHCGLGNPYLYDGSFSDYSAVHGNALLRQAVAAHGFAVLPAKPGAALSSIPAKAEEVSVDGKPMDSGDEEMAAALPALQCGDEARVYFKSGRTANVVVAARKAL